MNEHDENTAASQTREDARQAEKKHGILYYIGVGISGGLFAFVVLLGVLVIVVPAATGSTPMTVITGSMQPTYPPGTLVIVRPADPQSIRIGDPITYQIESGKDAVVTHRVIAVTQSTTGDVEFTTKGDANGAADASPVKPVQLKGKVWYAIPWIGYVNNLLSGDARAWLIPTIAIGLFLYAGWMLASGLASAARKRRNSTGDVSDDRAGHRDEVGGS